MTGAYEDASPALFTHRSVSLDPPDDVLLTDYEDKCNPWD